MSIFCRDPEWAARRAEESESDASGSDSDADERAAAKAGSRPWQRGKENMKGEGAEQASASDAGLNVCFCPLDGGPFLYRALILNRKKSGFQAVVIVYCCFYAL